MTSLDFVNAPLATANFVRIIEGKAPQAGGGRGGPPPGMGFGGPGARPEPPPIGQILDIKGGLANMVIASDNQKAVAIPKLPKTINAALKHDASGILGLSGPNTFYLTLKMNSGLDKKYAALGRVIAGLSQLEGLKKGDAIRSIRITRVGQAARDFKTDDDAFKKVMEKKK
jgi:cyclophilin family peptidyl-prolyl cis-trans isomerase